MSHDDNRGDDSNNNNNDNNNNNINDNNINDNNNNIKITASCKGHSFCMLKQETMFMP